MAQYAVGRTAKGRRVAGTRIRGGKIAAVTSRGMRTFKPKSVRAASPAERRKGLKAESTMLRRRSKVRQAGATPRARKAGKATRTVGKSSFRSAMSARKRAGALTRARRTYKRDSQGRFA